VLDPQVQDILQGCLDGKRSAQKALYDRFAGRMMAVCRRYIPSVPEAEDVYQEAWVKLFQNLHRFKIGEYSFDAWIQRIFINESINYYHKNRRHNYWQEDITDFNTDFAEAPEILGKMSASEIEVLIKQLHQGRIQTAHSFSAAPV
jgi:RNA polymerase sigma-70 factor (ECF subfamily)